MDTSTERLINAAQERYGWTGTTLLGVLTDYIANQDSDEALADYLAERGPEESGDDEVSGEDGTDPYPADTPEGYEHYTDAEADTTDRVCPQPAAEDRHLTRDR